MVEIGTIGSSATAVLFRAGSGIGRGIDFRAVVEPHLATAALDQSPVVSTTIPTSIAH